MTPPLTGIRVVELDDGPAQYAGTLLAALGADVVMIEPPGGSATRHARFRGGIDSIAFRHYAAGKRSVVLDLGTEADRTALESLVAAADVLVEGRSTADDGRLDIGEDELARLAPGLVRVIVTPFGLTGPWRGHRASDVVSMSLGGVTGQTGYDGVDGEPGTPITPVGNQARHFGGVLAATYTVAALRDRPAGGARTIDVALHDSVAVSTEIPVSLWEFGGQEVFRHTGRHASAAVTTPEWQFRCADGAYLCALTLYLNDRRFAAILDWFDSAGLPHDLHDDRFATEGDRVANMPPIVATIARFCALHDSTYLFHEAQRRALPWARVQPVPDVATDPQLKAREFFSTVRHADGTDVPHAGLPWRGMATIFSERGHRARPPRPGEDTADLLDALCAPEGERSHPVAGE